jgi:glycosyltransferase involved in cell wall biosynthesis
VPPGDVPALAAAVATLAADPLRRNSMGRAARALVERDFTEAIVARETLAIYQTELQRKAEQQCCHHG